MADQNTSTNRTKIGDAINSAVAMTEAETAQDVDAVLGAMPDKANGSNYQQVIDFQIQLEEIQAVAKLAGETCDDAPFVGTLGIIERRVKEVRYALNDLIVTDQVAQVAPLKEPGKGDRESPKAAKADIPIKVYDALCEAMMIVDGLQAVWFVSLDSQNAGGIFHGVMRNVQGELDQLDKQLNKLDKALRKGARLDILQARGAGKGLALKSRYKVRLDSDGGNKVAVIKVIKDNVTAANCPHGIGLAQA